MKYNRLRKERRPAVSTENLGHNDLLVRYINLIFEEKMGRYARPTRPEEITDLML